MASVTITIPNSNWNTSAFVVSWNAAGTGTHIPLGMSLSADGMTDLYCATVIFPREVTRNLEIRLSDGSGNPGVAGPEFSTEMEMDGSLTFAASNGDSLTVTGISDSTEPYTWIPSNIAAVVAFANTLAGLTNRSLTVTFDDNQNAAPTGTPVISDTTPDVGQVLTVDTSGIADADGLGTFSYQWQRGTTDIPAPEGTGASYTVDIADTGSTLRVVVSFTDGLGNSESVTSDSTSAVVNTPMAPVFADDTGDAQEWMQNAPITPITVPEASGNPPPTYAVEGTLPAGIEFDDTTRVLSGTPTDTGSGTITIRATNSEGSDDWAVAYSIAADPPGLVPKLLLDFGNDGTFSHAAADVTRDLAANSLRCYRGKTLQSRNESVAGRLTCRLWNLTGKYDVLNSSSPIFMRDISGIGVRFQLDGMTVWGGILDDIDYKERPVPHVQISALGRLSILRQPVSVGYQTSTTVGDVAQLVGTAAGIDNTYLGGTKTLDRWPGVREQEALTVLRQLEENEEGFLFERGDGLLELEEEDARLMETSAMTFADTNDVIDSVPLLRGSKLDQGFRHIVNVCRVPVETLTESAEVTLWTLPTDLTIAANGTETIIVEYPNAASPSDHRGAASWIAPVAGTDYTTQAGLSVTGAVVGDRYRLTLGNSSNASITISASGSNVLKVRGTALVVGDVLLIESRDNASITIYGEREYQRTSQLFTNIGDAQAYADGIVSRGASPHGWLIGYWPGHHSELNARRLDLSRRVTVHRTTSIADYYIEGIGIAMMGGEYARMEYLLSPVPGATVPSAPILTITPDPANSEMDLVWSEPFTGGNTITGYDVQYREQGAATWADWPHTGVGRTATITGLDLGKTYFARVLATNAQGNGPWSNEPSALLLGVPGAPTNAKFRDTINNPPLGYLFTGTWDPPAFLGASPITEIQIQYGDIPTSTFRFNHTITTGNLQTLATYQTNYNRQALAGSYIARIRYRNSFGDGEWTVFTRE